MTNLLDRIQIINTDITSLKVDAIVNAANSSLLGGGGVDGAIHRAAGSELLEACRKLNGCEVGQAKITKGYQLPAEWVIHTVGPRWQDGQQDEEALLASCYSESLNLAAQCGIRTIAFPAISTGIYGFPMERASRIAVDEIILFLENDEWIEMINLVAFSEKDESILKQVLEDRRQGPLIGKETALRIVGRYMGQGFNGELSVSEMPKGTIIYQSSSDPSSVWYVTVWEGPHIGGSRLLLVDKTSGNIVYDGPDGGE
ncbi:MAG: O-acetyl-ADP-ribose deacetylase [Candidatus Marinimicrobia bacterium]|nr:O-acetyl-ADP-ribose deacetylase [Candidatus Neomarinimicrobiota bacterium]